MAKQNWLNKQLDQASTVVRAWSEWKRETIRSQIADIAGVGTSTNRSNESAKPHTKDGEASSKADNHYHIELTRERAESLRDWLNDYLATK